MTDNQRLGNRVQKLQESIDNFNIALADFVRTISEVYKDIINLYVDIEFDDLIVRIADNNIDDYISRGSDKGFTVKNKPNCPVCIFKPFNSSIRCTKHDRVDNS